MFARATFLRRLMVGGLLTGTCIGGTAIGVLADPNDTAAPAAAAGQKIYVDPQTGARTSVPPRDVAAPASDPALSTSHEGLVEEPAPGGGTMIDLKGRFRSAAEAKVGADGKAHVGCREPGAASEQE